MPKGTTAFRPAAEVREAMDAWLRRRPQFDRATLLSMAVMDFVTRDEPGSPPAGARRGAAAPRRR